MICHDCHGAGTLRRTHPHWVFLKTWQIPIVIEVPCDRCKGSGVAYCCDDAGSAQPEPEPPTDA